MVTCTPEQIAESQYVVDGTNGRIKLRLADDRVVFTPMGSGTGKSVSPLVLAALRQK